MKATNLPNEAHAATNTNVDDPMEKLKHFSKCFISKSAQGDVAKQILLEAKCFLLAVKTHPNYGRFVDMFEDALPGAFPTAAFQREHNLVKWSKTDPDIVDLDNRCRIRFAELFVSSDNDLFSLTMRGMNVANITLRPFDAGTIELGRLFVHEKFRSLGVGTALVRLTQTIAQRLAQRVVLYPAPPLASESSNPRLDWIRAKEWYASLGFVDCPPQICEGIRLINGQPARFGWCDLMAFGEIVSQETEADDKPSIAGVAVSA